MISRIILFTLVFSMSNGQTGPVADKTVARMDAELFARLRWELLWNETPPGFRPPPAGTAKLAVCFVPRSSLSYCSHELGSCAEYRVGHFRIGHQIRSAVCSPDASPCNGGKNDLESVIAFAGLAQREAFSEKTRGQLPLPLGKFSSQFGGQLLWPTTAQIGNRIDILRYYRELRPAGMKNLQKWLRARHHDSNYRSITIPCFADSDPEVRLYGNRYKTGPVIISVFWEGEEREEWVVAGLLEGEKAQTRIQELRTQIESMACAVVTFP